MLCTWGDTEIAVGANQVTAGLAPRPLTLALVPETSPDSGDSTPKEDCHVYHATQ